MCYLPIFWMRARMNDSIHVQVGIVKFHLIWIGLSAVNRRTNAINTLRLKEKWEKSHYTTIIKSFTAKIAHRIGSIFKPTWSYVNHVNRCHLQRSTWKTQVKVEVRECH